MVLRIQTARKMTLPVAYDSFGQGVQRAQEELCRAKLLGEGYFVSTVGRDEEVIRNYIRHQEQEDARLEQLGLWR